MQVNEVVDHVGGIADQEPEERAHQTFAPPKRGEEGRPDSELKRSRIRDKVRGPGKANGLRKGLRSKKGPKGRPPP